MRILLIFWAMFVLISGQALAEKRVASAIGNSNHTMVPSPVLVLQQSGGLPQTEDGSDFSLQIAMFRGSESTGHWVHPPVTLIESIAYPPNIQIVSIRCIRPTVGSDQDQVYIGLFTSRGNLGKKSETRKMKAGDVWNPNFKAYLVKGTLQLLESDIIGSDDRIGIFYQDASVGGGQYVRKMTGDGAEYVVTVEVVR